MKNSFFTENLSAIEQLVLGSKCDDFVISNSTFSWWTAWLGEKENSKVIRPLKNFRGDFAKKKIDIDYFPERWISFDDKNESLQKKYLLFKIRGFVYEFLVGTKIIFRQTKNRFKKRIKKYL